MLDINQSCAPSTKHMGMGMLQRHAAHNFVNKRLFTHPKTFNSVELHQVFCRGGFQTLWILHGGGWSIKSGGIDQDKDVASFVTKNLNCRILTFARASRRRGYTGSNPPAVRYSVSPSSIEACNFN
jgi:hypothetical protein